MNTIYIALGSNLANPQQQLRDALQALSELPSSQLIACSSFYQNPAIGPGEQDDYINAVAKLESKLSPHALLEHTQALEDHHGRVRDVRWGARPLDVDIILFNQICSDDPLLTLPHPRATERNFVMRPLFEIEPTLIWPNGTPLADFSACHDNHNLCLIEASL